MARHEPADNRQWGRCRRASPGEHNLTDHQSHCYTTSVKIESEFRFQSTDKGQTADELLAALVEAGYSNTQARRAVLEALCRAQGQASSADILALGRSYHPRLGEVTVYRTLEILSSLGLVRKLHTDSGCHTYALATHHHGHHVLCQNCRQVVEFDGCDISQVISAVERQTGFAVSGHWLEVFGLCPSCRQAAREAAAGSDEREHDSPMPEEVR